jgi:hypothetical protein
VEKESVHLHGKSFSISWPGQTDQIDVALVEISRFGSMYLLFAPGDMGHRANLSRFTKRLISQLRSTQSHAVIAGIYTAMRVITSSDVPEQVRSITSTLFVSRPDC